MDGGQIRESRGRDPQEARPSKEPPPAMPRTGFSGSQSVAVYCVDPEPGRLFSHFQFAVLSLSVLRVTLGLHLGAGARLYTAIVRSRPSNIHASPSLREG